MLLKYIYIRSEEVKEKGERKEINWSYLQYTPAHSAAEGDESIQNCSWTIHGKGAEILILRLDNVGHFNETTKR